MAFHQLSKQVKQYLLITSNYWFFTLTDGALRMLVVLYFYQLGYSPLNIALLFLFYEFFGVVTNLLGGWLGSRIGLNKTMNIGLFLQICSLAMLLAPTSWLSVMYVMLAQALSGIAKDLNKMSAKSAIKSLIPKNEQSSNLNGTGNKLYQWVAFLTGSKNTLKGAGFFLGGFLLSTVGFTYSIGIMCCVLSIIWLISLLLLTDDIGKSKTKVKFKQLFSKSSKINHLSFARCFLFGARDIWFVVAIPVFFTQSLAWSHSEVGAFMACWVIIYGIIQTQAPKITHKPQSPILLSLTFWTGLLAVIPLVLAYFVYTQDSAVLSTTLVVGLMIFGAAFAVNSSLHSYLIVKFADSDNVATDVGFYYMANASGRLIGTVMSGWLFQQYGMVVCLISSTIFLCLATFASVKVDKGGLSPIP